MRKLSDIGGEVLFIGSIVRFIFNSVNWMLRVLNLDTGDADCGQHMTSMCRGGSCVIELAVYLISLLTYNALFIGNFKEWFIPRAKRYFVIRKKVVIRLNKKEDESVKKKFSFSTWFKSKEEEKRKLLPIEKDYLKADYRVALYFSPYRKV